MRVAVGVLLLLATFIVGLAIGGESARTDVADAIRAGRLSVVQRVDHIAEQIESRRYIPVE